MKILGLPIPDTIMKMCKPAQVYLILSLISMTLYLISMLDVHDKVLDVEPAGEGIHYYTLSGLVIKIIFTILWIYLLNYICQFKYGKKIAWFIVLLPFFFMGLMLIGLLCAISFITLQSKKNKDLQQKIDSQPQQPQQQPQQPQPQQQQQQQQPKMAQMAVKEPLSELLR
jgi:Na+/melibiose symporter-like transporter